jgi:hypothetical protein
MDIGGNGGAKYVLPPFRSTEQIGLPAVQTSCRERQQIRNGGSIREHSRRTPDCLTLSGERDGGLAERADERVHQTRRPEWSRGFISRPGLSPRTVRSVSVHLASVIWARWRPKYLSVVTFTAMAQKDLCSLRDSGVTG